MKPMSYIRTVAGAGALAALLSTFASPLSAQNRVYRGLDCSACNAGGAGYCVVNPFRFEYTCAPRGTYACVGVSRTSYCRYGTTCWDGFCR